MARKTFGKRRRMPSMGIDEKTLTKGQIRKLNALCKSVGDNIGTKAFEAWLKRQEREPTVVVDKNAEMITNALIALVRDKGLRIPRGGYLVKRGRGRVITTRAGSR